MEATSVKLQEKTKRAFKNPDIQSVINLKQGEHFEILEVCYDSFRQLLNRYLRACPLPEGTRIETIRISKKYRWVFKIDTTC